VSGISGFLANLDEMYESADLESPQWEAFLSAWMDRSGEHRITAADLVRAIDGNSSGLQDALPEQLADAHSRPECFSRRLGKALAQHVEKRYGDTELYIERAENDSHAKVARWRVRQGKPDAGFQAPTLNALSAVHSSTYFNTAEFAAFTPSPTRMEARNTPADTCISITEPAERNTANPAGDDQVTSSQLLTSSKSSSENPANPVCRPCFRCRGTRFYRYTPTGPWVCADCHPPVPPESVAGWMDTRCPENPKT
jgi:hypothetical protein